MIQARYVHTNLVARDWRRLADFYQQVLGCTPVPPQRDLSGEWLDRATGIRQVAIQGIHLRLPGYGDDGPTLEVFQYNDRVSDEAGGVNRPGFGHVAFAVDDVAAALEAVVAAGGSTVGEMVHVQVAGAGELTFVYAQDPEGNVIELQRWAEEATKDD